jgi:3-oxoacyl-[acyl-carrier-protein] synthase II
MIARDARVPFAPDAIVVTGIGAASALGSGIEAHRAALWEGRDGFRAVDRFDTRDMGTRIAATWSGWDGRKQPEVGEGVDLYSTSTAFPLHDLALTAAREAWSVAGPVVDPRRAALVFGTCYGQGFKEFSPVTERIAAGLDIAGPRITITTACASSTNAIGVARDLLLHGHADVVVAGGADALLREALAGFSALGVLSSEPCAPFSDPPGTTLGEGAAFLVLERGADAARRRATTWASIRGYGLSGDAHHETTPDPSGAGLARAIRGALDDAGWRPEDVEYVSAHATGTANNDRIEWSVIERELGAPGRPPPVSGSKGHVGHVQGAAGALELVLALLCHREGRVPSTLHFRGARPGCPADPVAGKEPRVMPVSRGLKLSAAFGGANAVVAYECGDAPAPMRLERTRSPVVVTGAGVVGPRGPLRIPQILALTEKRAVGTCPEVDLHSLGVDPRRLDRSARWLTAAAALALSQGGREGMDRTGLFVAGARMPEQSARRCAESIRLRGIAGTSSSAFARMSVNAPAGACSLALGLLGPTSTLSSGESSGLLAVVLAAEWLAWRGDAVRIVAGGVDELSGLNADEAEGAACLALERSPVAPAGAVVAAGWGIAGADGAREAVARAMSGRPRVDGVILDGEAPLVGGIDRWLAPRPALGVIEARRLWGAADATRSCVMAAVAAAHLAEGHADSLLLVAARGASSVALVLERTGAR